MLNAYYTSTFLKDKLTFREYHCNLQLKDIVFRISASLLIHYLDFRP